MNEINNGSSWRTILENLAITEIDFLVVGGAALVLHGIPRSTLDIDIYCPVENYNFTSLIDLLQNKLKLTPKISLTDNLVANPTLLAGQWITFCLPNGLEIIDIFCCQPSEFQKLYDDAVFISFYGVSIALCNLKNLRQMKEICHRPTDLADIALIDEYEKVKNQKF